MKLQVESSIGGHAGLAFNALVCVCVWLCKKKYDTHKLKLAANARWQRRMRIVLYFLGGSIKPLKRRRHKTPQAGVITLWSPMYPHVQCTPLFPRAFPAFPPFCRSDKAIKSNLFGFVRASFLLPTCLFLFFSRPFIAAVLHHFALSLAMQPKSMPHIFHNSLSFATKSAALFHLAWSFLSTSKLIIILAIYFMAHGEAGGVVLLQLFSHANAFCPMPPSIYMQIYVQMWTKK